MYIELVSYNICILFNIYLYNRIEAYSVIKIINNEGIIKSDLKRGSHARGVYPTQDTLRMGAAKVKREEEADTRIIVKEEEADTRII